MTLHPRRIAHAIEAEATRAIYVARIRALTTPLARAICGVWISWRVSWIAWHNFAREMAGRR